MIYLEEITNQILMEEGQMLLSISDFDITWEKIEKLFIGTFQQAKDYITIYDWENQTLGNDPKQLNISHIKHITYNPYQNMQRAMPDVPHQYWEFNPYTKNASALMNTNFTLEVAKPATLQQLPFEIELTNVKANKAKTFNLPITPSNELQVSINGQIVDLNMDIQEVEYSNIDKNFLDNSKNCPCKNSDNSLGLEINGDIQGTIDLDNLKGSLTFNKDYNSVTLTFTSKYIGIKELDMSCELFYTWYKSNLLIMLGSLKSQIDLNSSGLPFDFNADGLLDRGKELRNKLDDLKVNKSHWSNF